MLMDFNGFCLTCCRVNNNRYIVIKIVIEGCKNKREVLRNENYIVE